MIKDNLEQAHKLSLEASSLVNSMLTLRIFNKSAAIEAHQKLLQAANYLEALISKPIKVG